MIYMGMVPEAAIAMLACARIGAVHSVVFGGFSAQAISDRITDCGARVVITQDEGRRGGRLIPLKATVDEALIDHDIDAVLVFRHTGAVVHMESGRDVDWASVVGGQSLTCDPCLMPAEAPLFILYVRFHGHAERRIAYLWWLPYLRCVYPSERLWIGEEDVYACVADVGWITGHTYIVYGPLANGCTTMMFESTPMYPNAGALLGSRGSLWRPHLLHGTHGVACFGGTRR